MNFRSNCPLLINPVERALASRTKIQAAPIQENMREREGRAARRRLDKQRRVSSGDSPRRHGDVIHEPARATRDVVADDHVVRGVIIGRARTGEIHPLKFAAWN